MKTFSSYILHAVVAFTVLFSLAACSNDSYLNSIPADSSALISLSTPKSFLDYKGIDVGSKVFLFVSADGNLGVCAKVNDSDELEEYLNHLAEKGLCEKVTKKRGYRFSMLKNSFLAGFSDNSLLLMGPITLDGQAVLMNQMARLFAQDEEHSILSSRLYTTIDSIDAPMAMVAQAKALPEQIVTPFTLGTPQGTDASQVYVSAAISISKGVLLFDGKTFSYNKTVNQSLQEAAQTYRPLKGRYTASMPSDAPLGLFMNIDGKKFLPLLRGNRGIQALLAGINGAIDMDNIIKSIDGDMSLVMPVNSPDHTNMSMAAELSNANWLADVDYWKQSCPSGASITNWKKKAFTFTDGKTTFCFGVSDDLQFYSGRTPSAALASIRPSDNPQPANIQKLIKGQKLVMIINMGALSGKQAAILAYLKPVLGDIDKIVYRLK